MKKFMILAAATMLTSPAFAIHMYAGFSCENAEVELNYDGPGSNYAVGGYSHLYSKKSADGTRAKALAYDQQTNGDGGKLGEEIGAEKLEVFFSVVDSKIKSTSESSIKAGDACEPGEYDYNHTESVSEDVVEIQDATSEAASRLGVQKGQKIKLTCHNTSDIPVVCPASGKYSAEDVE